MDSAAYPRRHGRLESFLQRLLAHEMSRVSWYEPCIVDGCGSQDKPFPAFVVLTDDTLYIVGNPPRHLRAILPLSEMVGLQLVHESPTFLNGQDRESTQHIKLTCNVQTRYLEENSLRASSRLSSSSRATSRPSSVLSEALSLNSDPGVSGTDSERKIRRAKKFLTSLSWPKKRSLVQHDSIGEESSISSWDSSDRNSEVTSISPIPVGISPGKLRPNSWLSHPTGMLTSDSHICSPEVAEHLPEKQGTESPFFTHRSFENNQRPMSSVPREVAQPLGEASALLGSIGMPGFSLKHALLPRSKTALGNYGDHLKWPSRALLNPLCDDGKSISSDQEVKRSNAQVELHIYILTLQSHFFRHLKSVWHSRLVKDTLNMGYPQSHQFKNHSREHYEKLFQELHCKLQQRSEDDAIEIRQMVDRINKDVANSTIAKKLFWKDPNLFTSIISKVRILMSASENLGEFTIGFTMDKIKASTCLLRMLTSMLQGVEKCHGRTRHLTYRNGHRTKELLTSLVIMPWIPANFRNVVVSTVTSYDLFAAKDWETMMEAPLIRSVTELTNISTMALYQCFQLAMQTSDLVFNHKMCNIAWMVKIICDVKSVDSFLAHLMCQLLQLTRPTELTSLTPGEAVLLHQQLWVISTLLNNSPVLTLHIRIMFCEEIRYFVQTPVIERKIAENYPIRSNILSLTEMLRKAVLGRKEKAFIPSHLFPSYHEQT